MRKLVNLKHELVFAGTDVSKEELSFKASAIWGSGKEDRQNMAARVMQNAALKYMLGKGYVLNNSMLLERLHLELQLQRGLRLLVLCMCMFGVVILAAVQERQGPDRLGLLSTYKSLFHLDDSLAEIKTIDNLFDYLRLVSEKSRIIMPTSSVYFAETGGELTVMRGVRAFDKDESVEVADLVPRIDSPAFSFMAWVQLEKGRGGGFIVRKPLGTSSHKSLLRALVFLDTNNLRL